MAKVVIDANVIISAAFGGNPFKSVARAMMRGRWPQIVVITHTPSEPSLMQQQQTPCVCQQLNRTVR